MIEVLDSKNNVLPKVIAEDGVEWVVAGKFCCFALFGALCFQAHGCSCISSHAEPGKEFKLQVTTSISRPTRDSPAAIAARNHRIFHTKLLKTCAKFKVIRGMSEEGTRSA